MKKNGNRLAPQGCLCADPCAKVRHLAVYLCIARIAAFRIGQTPLGKASGAAKNDARFGLANNKRALALVRGLGTHRKTGHRAPDQTENVSSSRRLISRHTARLNAFVAVLHRMISSMVRKQPSHKPVCGFILHTLMQGDGTWSPAASGSNSGMILMAPSSPFFVPACR